MVPFALPPAQLPQPGLSLPPLCRMLTPAAAAVPRLAGAGDRWVGVASIFQVFFVLGSALMFFISRSPGENAGYDSFL